jgi:hypothetical protein
MGGGAGWIGKVGGGARWGIGSEGGGKRRKVRGKRTVVGRASGRGERAWGGRSRTRVGSADRGREAREKTRAFGREGSQRLCDLVFLY